MCSKSGHELYTNVTVTTKAKNYIFILHAGGMTSLKVAELPPDLQQKLGYAAATAPKGPTNTAAVWAKKEIAKIDVPQIKDLGKQLEQKWRGQSGCQAVRDGFGWPQADFRRAGSRACCFICSTAIAAC